MTDHDQLFKKLISEYFCDFLELFLPQVATEIDGEHLLFLDKELFSDDISPSKEADLVIKTKKRKEDAFFLVHIELESSAKPDFPEKMFRYFTFLRSKYLLPIYPIAVLSFDSPRTAQASSFKISFPDLDVLSFNFRTIQLNNLNWKDYQNRKNPVAAAFMSKMRIGQEERPYVKLECMKSLVSLDLSEDRIAFLATFVDSYLQLNPKEELIYQRQLVNTSSKDGEAIMEHILSWTKKGIEQGLEQGRAEGRADEREHWRARFTALLIKQYHLQFGEISEDTKKKITGLTASAVEELAQKDFTSLAELESWLTR